MILAVSVAVLVSVVWVVGDHQRDRAEIDKRWQALDLRAHALKDELDQRFPPGTPQGTFVEFSASKGLLWHSDDQQSYLSLGQAPSRVWYCHSWEGGIVAHFKAGKLVSTETNSWSTSCL